MLKPNMIVFKLIKGSLPNKLISEQAILSPPEIGLDVMGGRNSIITPAQSLIC
jgi:hypothetical protein